MKPPEEPSASSDTQGSGNSEPEFEQALAEVERSLMALKERYAQVQRDRQRQAELKHRYEEIRQDRSIARSQEMKTQLKQIQQELETLEVNLESSLFSWSSLKEPFWMAVRFAGIGIVIGWLLKSCAN
jgi:exonuclease VII small subunit